MREFFLECTMALCIIGLVALWLISEGIITR